MPRAAEWPFRAPVAWNVLKCWRAAQAARKGIAAGRPEQTRRGADWAEEVGPVSKCFD
jgi:hypothetical protein